MTKLKVVVRGAGFGGPIFFTSPNAKMDFCEVGAPLAFSPTA